MEAKEYLERALAIWQQTLGPQHPDVATSYNNLATVLRNEGDLKQAKEYHERALAIRLQILGPQHTSFATTFYNNLATVLRNQAKEYHVCALAIMLQTLGHQHVGTTVKPLLSGHLRDLPIQGVRLIEVCKNCVC